MVRFPVVVSVRIFAVVPVPVGNWRSQVRGMFCASAVVTAANSSNNKNRYDTISAFRSWRNGGGGSRRLRRNSFYQTAGTLQDLDVLHVRVGAESNPFDPSIGLSHHERAVARDLVLLLIVNQFRRSQSSAVFTNDDDVLPRDHVVGTAVVGAVL